MNWINSALSLNNVGYYRFDSNHAHNILPNLSGGASLNNNWPDTDGENTWITISSDGSTPIAGTLYVVNKDSVTHPVSVYRVIDGTPPTLDTTNLITSGGTIAASFQGFQAIVFTPDTSGVQNIMFTSDDNQVFVYTLLST